MADQATDPLPHDFPLGEYRVDRRISGGGFSMVYLALDASESPVVIKEYLPDGVVKRGPDGRVEPLTEDKTKPFLHGMRYFFDEGRALATIHHPNVVRVLNFFRANNTVYMVMRYEEGKTLQRHIHDLGAGLMREGFIRGVFVQLLNGLREVHARKLLHLDIKPSNIYLRTDGSPVLIDFGAARQALSQDAQRQVPMYTPGFAAPEQYNQHNRLGPWTDLYGIGASMYACLAKAPPPPADQRQKQDQFAPASEGFAREYTPDLLELIDSMLRLDYMERPQSVFSVQKRLVDYVPRQVPPAKTSWMEAIKERLNRPL